MQRDLLNLLLKPTCPNKLALHRPRGFTSSLLMQTGPTASPRTHSLTIYQILYEVRDSKSARWKQEMLWLFIITYRCCDLRSFCFNGAFFQAHTRSVDSYFQGMPSLNHSSTPTVHLEQDVLRFHNGIPGVHQLYGFINNVSGKCYQHLLTAFR